MVGSTRDFQTWAWDARTGSPAGPAITTRTVEADAVELPGGTALLTRDGYDLALRDLTTGAVLRSGKLGSGPHLVGAVAAAVVGERGVIAVAQDDQIGLVDLSTGQPIGAPLIGHEGAVTALAAVEVDGSTFLVSSSHDRSIRIWDLTRRMQV